MDAFKALTGCIPTGVSNITPPESTAILKAYPNPSVSGTTIEYDFSNIKAYNKAQIVFYNMLGKQVKSIPVEGSQGSLDVGKNTLSPGMYFYSLMVDGSRLKTEKLEVL